uniref:Uncharacterized protein n=1 Tax=Anguilla anguilla TaxID=7936 RepID=A0A0E9XZF2_ANGAN
MELCKSYCYEFSS